LNFDRRKRAPDCMAPVEEFLESLRADTGSARMLFISAIAGRRM